MMSSHRQRLYIATWIAFTMLLATSCSNTATGNPVPTTDQPSTTTSSENGSNEGTPTEAPPVEDPLDLTRFLPQPCRVLTPSQLATFGVTSPGEPTTTGPTAERVGPWCSWVSTDAGSISVGFLTINTSGMDNIYHNRGEFEYFEPTTVDGYPAVFAEAVDLRDAGSCNIIVGVSDTMTFRAAEQGREDSEGSCDRAKQVARAALTTIRGGG